MRKLPRFRRFLSPALLTATVLLAAPTLHNPSWAQQAATPATDQAAAAPPQAAPLSAKIIEWVNQDFRVEKPSSVYKAAADNSDALGEVLAGSDIRVIGVVVDGDWLEVLMPDGTTVGFIPSDAVPAAVSPPPPPISGHPVLRDTGTLTIGDRTFPLAGIDGVSGPAVEDMQKYIASYGDTVTCDPEGLVRYVCTLPDGTDLARLALVNGAARLAVNARDEYAQQLEIAQHEKRGIWAQGVSQPARAVYEVNTAWQQAESAVAPIDSLAADINFIDNEPLIYVDGESVAVLYDQDYGWGYWDHDHRFHHAPDRWRSRLEERFPHGEGVHRHPDTFVRQQNEALRASSVARTGAMGGGARPGMAGVPGGAARPAAFAAGRPASSFTGAVRSGPTNSASSFVQQHMSREAVASRAGGGFGAFGGGHAGGMGGGHAGGMGGGMMRGGGAQAAHASAPSGGRRGK
jgi:hypothetical protein